MDCLAGLSSSDCMDVQVANPQKTENGNLLMPHCPSVLACLLRREKAETDGIPTDSLTYARILRARAEAHECIAESAEAAL